MGIIDHDIGFVNPQDTKAKAKTGQPSSADSGQPADKTKPKQALLRFRGSGIEPTEVHPAVLEPNDWDSLAKNCKQCSGGAVLEVINLDCWPDEARSELFSTVRERRR